MLHTTARSAMDHIVPPRPVQPLASDFYKHPYGGIARDIFVTREGFMRFFEVNEFDMAFAESFAGQGKIYNTLGDEHEYFGYINLFPGGRLSYMITIIDRSVTATKRHFARMTKDMPDDTMIQFTQKGTGHVVVVNKRELNEWN